MKTSRYHNNGNFLDILALHKKAQKIWLECKCHEKVRWNMWMAIRMDNSDAIEFRIKLNIWMFTTPVSASVSQIIVVKMTHRDSTIKQKVMMLKRNFRRYMLDGITSVITYMELHRKCQKHKTLTAIFYNL